MCPPYGGIFLFLRKAGSPCARLLARVLQPSVNWVGPLAHPYSLIQAAVTSGARTQPTALCPQVLAVSYSSIPFGFRVSSGRRVSRVKAGVSSACGPYWASSPCVHPFICAIFPPPRHVQIGRGTLPSLVAAAGHGFPVPQSCSPSVNACFQPPCACPIRRRVAPKLPKVTHWPQQLQRRMLRRPRRAVMRSCHRAR